MTPRTLLLRQIHPNFVQADRVTSQAFRPTPKDQNKLSADDGDRISPEAAWKRFVENPDCRSVGVMAIGHAECVDKSLEVIADGDPYPEHVSIDFKDFKTSQIEKIAKRLALQARARGWLFQSVAL